MSVIKYNDGSICIEFPDGQTIKKAVEHLVKHKRDLACVNLSDADLSGADLTGADLSGANLSRADLDGTYLSFTNLIGANLTGADLTGARLSFADLSRADLSRADLSGANLSSVILSGANLTNVIPAVDAVPDLAKKVLEAIEARRFGLYMKRWHSECGTTHCLAGFATYFGGLINRELAHGANALGGLIWHKSEGVIPSFYSSNETALKWLEEHVARKEA